MDRLQSMRVFQRVIDEGSFAAAARSLDMSPAVVTRLVADLEGHLAVRLLHRTTRRIALTPAGENYLARIRGILQEIDEVHAMTSAQAEELAGVLRILAPPVLATHMLAPALAGFRERYPSIVLDIEVRTTDEPQVEDYDITLVDNRIAIDAEHVRRKVVDSEAILVASPQYLKRHGAPRTPQELVQHACLRLVGPGRRAHTWRMWPANLPEQHLDLEVQPVLWANHADTLIRAALDGAGITSTAGELAAPYLASGQLQRVLEPWITGRLTMYAAFPTRKYMPQRTRVFIEHLVEHAKLMTDAAHRAASA